MAELTTIARPYGQALFELARNENALADWSETLALLAAVAQEPQAAELLESPQLTSERKADLLLSIVGDRLNEEGKNFVRLLAENQRMEVLPEILVLFEELRNEAEGAVDAELLTARPATEEQKTRVAEALKRRLGREIHLECKTDESLLGGAIIRAGDLVIDGSAQGKLSQLANALSL
jgi:F-type H+-transporting ATPase subunit delta